MKFGKFLEKNLIKEWKFFYVDYKKLKKVISKYDSNLFYKNIANEINKLNNFVELISNYENVDNDKISSFLVMNYMALFKSIKKHDKKTSKLSKIYFFDKIKELPFYKYYLNIPRKVSPVKLVVFDKDGTLINIQKLFSNWIEKVYNNFSSFITDKNNFYNHLGYIESEKKFTNNSVIARGTRDDLRNSINEFLINVEKINDNKIIDNYWTDIEFDKNDIIQCGDIIKVFDYLKNYNIKIAICTSDNRKPTEETIKFLGLEKYIDDIKCGDDFISSKPSPEPLWKICSNLDVNVDEAVMVGDTISDIHSGLNAKFGRVIGVLSGGYDENDLDNADIILNSIDNLPELFNNSLYHNNNKN
jgi:phosphoglycolate phosphatase